MGICVWLVVCCQVGVVVWRRKEERRLHWSGACDFMMARTQAAPTHLRLAGRILDRDESLIYIAIAFD